MIGTDQKIHTGEKKQDLAAAGFMLISVLGFSAIPTIIALSEHDAPFLLTAGLRIGAVIGYSIFLATVYRSTFFDTGTWNCIFRSAVKSPLSIRNKTFYSPLPILLATITYFDYTFFALAIVYIDVAIATVFYETWPLFLIALTGMLFAKDKIYRNTSKQVYFLTALGFIGFTFVVMSQSSGGLLDFGSTHQSHLLIGFGLLIVSLVLAPLSAFGLRWGVDLSRGLDDSSGSVSEGKSVELFGVLIANLLGNIVILPANFTAGVVSGETISIQVFMYALLSGIVFLAVANIAWRKANLVTHELGINTISYFTPVFGLIWLFMFSLISLPRTDFLIVGTAAIITANLLINFAPEIRIGFKALLLALWFSGLAVYFRENIFAFAPVDNWHWPAQGYFESIALSATVFTLILSFRVARLVNRTNEEENHTFKILRRVESLTKRNVIDKQLLYCILEIDRSNKSTELNQAYNRTRNCVAMIDSRTLESGDREALVQIESDLDILYRSKQTNIDLGEMFSLFIFAGIVISLSLLTRPPGNETWTLLLVDVFGMLIAAVVVFLVGYVIELQTSSNAAKIGADTERNCFFAREINVVQPPIYQWISGIFGVAIIAGYCLLLADKWLSPTWLIAFLRYSIFS